MLQLSASEKLTGQCPQCGWCPPPQNAFRPNIMNEYVNEKGITVVLSEADDRVETPSGVYLRKRDANGQLIKRVAPPGAVGGPLTQQPMQQPQLTYEQVQALQNQQVPQTQTIIPSRDIPAGLMKTPEEIAKTPKPTVTPVVLPTPTMSNAAAPAQTPNVAPVTNQP